MKKILLILCVCLIASFANAQVNIKDMARADKAIALISSEMSELKAPQIKFVKQALLNKYMSNRKATSGKGLSSEEKKNIFKISREKTKNSLLNNFSKSQVNNILKFEGQSLKGVKNTKGKNKINTNKKVVSNNKDEAKANKAIALISSEMSELKAPQIKFIKQTLLNKYKSNRKTRNTKGLSSEKKQNSFKISREKTKKSLLKNFSKSKVANILKFEKQSFSEAKNTNKKNITNKKGTVNKRTKSKKAKAIKRAKSRKAKANRKAKARKAKANRKAKARAA